MSASVSPVSSPRPSLETFLQTMADLAIVQNTSRSLSTAVLLRTAAAADLPSDIGAFLGAIGLLTTFVPPVSDERLRELAFWYRLAAEADLLLGHRTWVRVDFRCVEVWNVIARSLRQRPNLDDSGDLDLAAQTFELEVDALRRYLGIDETSREDS